MKALVKSRPEPGLWMEEVPAPVIGINDVLVRVKKASICGTDIHILKGALPIAKPPMVLGHEASGEIAAVGANVDHVREGDRVTLDAVVGCGHCYLCQRGSFQFCAKGFEFGITRDGGCQEYLVVPKRNVYRIADTVSFEEAATVFDDPLLVLQDASRNEEPRDAVIGFSSTGRLLTVVHIEFDGQSI